MNPRILFLNEFDLTLPGLLKLGQRKIFVKIHLRYPKYEKWYRYKPETRGKKIDNFLNLKYKKLLKLLPHDNFKKRFRKKRIFGIDIQIKANQLKLFLNKDIIDSISIEKIQGIKKIVPGMGRVRLE